AWRHDGGQQLRRCRHVEPALPERPRYHHGLRVRGELPRRSVCRRGSALSRDPCAGVCRERHGGCLRGARGSGTGGALIMTDLFTPLYAGPFELPHRVVMAPMTRNRAGDGNAPHALNATYYQQRSDAAFIITEATQVCPEGMGYPGTPGIHSDAQIDGWREVTDAVHEAGGRI
ncbi:unnamed protein product, partial [Laminaria digitata]